MKEELKQFDVPVTMTERMRDALNEMAQFQGISRSALCREYLIAQLIRAGLMEKPRERVILKKWPLPPENTQIKPTAPAAINLIPNSETISG